MILLDLYIYMCVIYILYYDAWIIWIVMRLLLGYFTQVCIWDGPKYSHYATGFSINKKIIFILKIREHVYDNHT